MQFESVQLFPEESPTLKKCKNSNCCVPYCDAEKDETVSYHQFPKAGNKVFFENKNGQIITCDLRKIWQDRVGIDKKITKYTRVCSLHFKHEDYTSKSYKSRNRRLKSVAVPSLNLIEENAFVTFKETFKPLCKLNIRNINEDVASCGSKQPDSDPIDQNNNQKLESQTLESVKNKETDIIEENEKNKHLTFILMKNDEPENGNGKKIEQTETKAPNLDTKIGFTLRCVSDETCDKQNTEDVETEKNRILDMILMYSTFKLEKIKKFVLFDNLLEY